MIIAPEQRWFELETENIIIKNIIMLFLWYRINNNNNKYTVSLVIDTFWRFSSYFLFACLNDQTW